MITPVENGSTSSGAQPSSCADRDADGARIREARFAGARVGVAGIDDETRESRGRARAGRQDASRHTVTGAAQNRFCVKTPAATVPGSARMSRTSSRSQFLIFAAVAPSVMPGTGSSDSAVGGV